MTLRTFAGPLVSAALLAALAVPAAPAQATAPAAVGPAAEVLTAYRRLETNVIKAAEKMPEDGFQFRPTPDIRPYARIVNHITEAQLRYCAALNGTEADPQRVPSDTAAKDVIVEGLKASFADCDKAYAALTDATIAQIVPLGKGSRSRIGLAWANVSHNNEQYAELSTYLRLKGLIPPTSEK